MLIFRSSLSDRLQNLHQRFHLRSAAIKQKWNSWAQSEEVRRKADREEYERRWRLYDKAQSLGVPLFEIFYWRDKTWPTVAPLAPEWDPSLEETDGSKKSETSDHRREADKISDDDETKECDSYERLAKEGKCGNAHRIGGKRKQGKEKSAKHCTGNEENEINAGEKWTSKELGKPEEEHAMSERVGETRENDREAKEKPVIGRTRQRYWFWNRKGHSMKKSVKTTV